MKKRENTEFIVENYYYPLPEIPFDFNLELQLTQQSIEGHREKIDLANEYDIVLEPNGPLPDLIRDSHILKDMLEGFFDILVIVEGAGEDK